MKSLSASDAPPAAARPNVVLVGEELARRVGKFPHEVGNVCVVSRAADFYRALAGGPLGASRVIVLAATGAFGVSASVLLPHVIRVDPAARTVIYVPRDVSTSRALPALIRAGAADIVMDVTDVFWERVHEIVQEACELRTGPRIVAAVAPFIPAELRDVCQWSAMEAHQPIGVEDLAAWMGVSRSSVRRRFALNMNLRPSDWLMWLRLLYVLDLLARGLSLTRVAGLLDFSAATHVRRLVRRFEGKHPDMSRPLTFSSALKSLQLLLLESKAERVVSD
jgi:AraC-like DNA-binding protein